MRSSPSDIDDLIQPFAEPPPLLIVLSGPSGVGKDAVRKGLESSGYPFHFAVTCTTRPPRPNETPGVDYYFVSEDEYLQRLSRDEFIAPAVIYGYRYGTPVQDVRQALARGEDVLLRIDVQGARAIKPLAPPAVFIFLMPSSLEELIQRIRRRRTEQGSAVEQRIAEIQEEMTSLSLFDYAVVNRDGALDQAVQRILAILQAEKCRVPPRRVTL